MSGVNKIKYVVTVAKAFLSYHSRAGQPTGFAFSITTGMKVHTIRPNYEGWKKKAEKIDAGLAVLDVRQWSGVPYRTPQEELEQISVEGGAGISKLVYNAEKDLFLVNDSVFVTVEELAKNDGLSVEDFKEWFKVFPVEPMAIVHFTPFRY